MSEPTDMPEKGSFEHECRMEWARDVLSTSYIPPARNDWFLLKSEHSLMELMLERLGNDVDPDSYGFGCVEPILNDFRTMKAKRETT